MSPLEGMSDMTNGNGNRVLDMIWGSLNNISEKIDKMADRLAKVEIEIQSIKEDREEWKKLSNRDWERKMKVYGLLIGSSAVLVSVILFIIGRLV